MVMTTAEFLAHLERHRDHRLAFNAGDVGVAAGYHVTEVKATTIHAVDCGGRSTHWNETTIQLWSPGTAPGDELMGVRKFLDIYDRVGRMVPIDDAARVRVEYGAPGEPAIAYVVTDVVTREGGVLDVHLAAPAVACKARDRSVGDVPLIDAAAPTLERTGAVLDVVDARCCAPSGTLHHPSRPPAEDCCG
ncbi:MAG: hypothetical protein EA416_01295 [Trueperaceae bacterium]|nr:MAG: hypothetical protein EA416_01295 [Trueperaceae bacterium]